MSSPCFCIKQGDNPFTALESSSVRGFFCFPSLNSTTNHGIPIMKRAASEKERIGYPTQKPLALLDRIIKASSNAGDVVLDPFAGCATACVSAETLGRQWVGIDLSEPAASLRRDSKKRSSCSTRFTTETTSRSERTLGSSRATERTGISYSASRRDGAEGVVWPSRFATSPSTTWCHKVRAARTTSTTCNFCVGHVIL